jgi:hypothetical protein
VKRRLFNLAAAMSVVLCAVTVVLWVRSYWTVDNFGVEGVEAVGHWQRGGFVCSRSGTLGAEWWLRDNGGWRSRSATGWGYDSWPIRSVETPHSWWRGFSYEAESFNNALMTSDGRPAPVHMTYSHSLTVPHWFVLLLAVLPSAFWLGGRARRRRRLRENLCLACGYDLRATPNACPECGTQAKPQPAERTVA